MLSITLDQLRALLRREQGQTMAEYAVVLAVIVIGIIAALTTLGTNIGAVLNSVAGSLT